MGWMVLSIFILSRFNSLTSLNCCCARFAKVWRRWIWIPCRGLDFITRQRNSLIREGKKKPGAFYNTQNSQFEGTAKSVCYIIQLNTLVFPPSFLPFALSLLNSPLLLSPELSCISFHSAVLSEGLWLWIDNDCARGSAYRGLEWLLPVPVVRRGGGCMERVYGGADSYPTQD